MQVTSLLSRAAASDPSGAHPGPARCDQDHDHQHDHDHGHDHGHEHIQVHLTQTLIGVIFIVNSFVVQWVFEKGAMVAGLSAMIGAVILGAPIIWTSWRDLRRGILSINELVSIAVLAAFAGGDYQTAGVVAFFMLLGEIIETRTAAGARASIESLIKLTPTKARRVRNGQEEDVPASELGVGDVIRVRPGDNVAADGVILQGQGSINQATITGESLPADKKPGDEVFAGTQNLTGALEIKVTRAGHDTTLGRVRDLILAAEKTRLPLMRIIDQYMHFYTPLVLVIAALVWAFTKNLNSVIAVLVVSCPCAFILASPTAMVAALSAAARLGILIKNVGDLELAARINAIIFDKTGTLTVGDLAVSRLAPREGTTPAELLRLAASAEKFSNHPAAKALQRLAQEAGVPLADPLNFTEAAGRGIRAEVNGDTLLVGRAQWLRDSGLREDLLRDVDLNETEGFSLIFVARNQKPIGWIGLQDAIRPEAKPALASLLECGVRRIAMVTGDRQPVATRVAREIGCEEVVAECLPQNKVQFVREMKTRGYRVAVVGDGVNDAPALAAGDLGIAMGAAGSEVAIHSATIALMNNDLRRLPFLVRLSRSTRSVINQNFLFGVFFIIGGLTLASFGKLHPIVAAMLHNVGSLIVVFNSARLVRQGEDLDPFRGSAAAAPPAAPSGSAPVAEPQPQPA
ncbi:MAG TPA: cation-translocating P-type ATPase [Candidatus Paceibacterota bacterium]|nr:cation-translocating P-type ATPase [Verrucomicrobiota bacterium]HOX02243.1 cation-translocating P-type ATPase [Verrucomicrobiota bacterium]HRZ46073.1 cation-translocating P-type ATPase [Candidatus Paceibacterota bacterium]